MKYDLVICAIAKNEQPYLLEWIAYHRVIGVDHFYLLDNESSDGSFQLLSALQKAGIVTLIRWPNRISYAGFEGIPVGPQVPGYNFVLRLLKTGKLAKWVAFLDLDEFVVPSSGNFKDLIQLYDGCAGVALNWRIFGSSGHRALTANLVIERFKRCSELTFAPNKHVKCCVQVRKIDRANTHVCYPAEGQIVRTNGEEIDYDRDGLEDVILDDVAVINHYFVKSQAEWTNKRNRGRATRPIGDPEKFRDESMFVEYDRNEESDSRIDRFLSATKVEMTVLKERLLDQLV
jgi:hypothetical protein